MDFGGAFGVGFSGSFSSGRYVPWWLAGGVAAGDCVAAYQAKGAASYAASKVNLANPGTYDAADGTAYPTWDAATGWTGGSGKNLLTGVVPVKTYSCIVKVDGASGPPIGTATSDVSVLRWRISINYASSLLFQIGSYYFHSPSVGTGVMALTYGGCYIDGIRVENGFSTSAVTSVPIRLLSDNMGTMSGRLHAAAIYSSTLTATQVAAITAAMQAL